MLRKNEDRKEWQRDIVKDVQAVMQTNEESSVVETPEPKKPSARGRKPKKKD